MNAPSAPEFELSPVHFVPCAPVGSNRAPRAEAGSHGLSTRKVGGLPRQVVNKVSLGVGSIRDSPE